ncbi:TPA: hypothetical protein DIV55_04345 [Patescibacteria group bacterium]|nr:hypothetical protein [Patescibacteria group bacterium]
MTGIPFSHVTRKDIELGADNEKIFQRGLDYFKSHAVSRITLEDSTLHGRVRGSYDTYSVEITDTNGKLSYACSCPYEGSGCKHIVATLLTFLDQKEEILAKAHKNQTATQTLSEKLQLLDTTELIELLLLSLKNHRDWKQILLKTVIKKLEKKGDRSNITDIYEQQFRQLIDRVSEILTEHNEYGGGSESEQDEAFELLDDIVELFKQQKLTQQLKLELIDKLFFFYDWNNSGMEDMLLDTIYDVCEISTDWKYVIKKLSKTKDEYKSELIQKIKKEKLKENNSV